MTIAGKLLKGAGNLLKKVAPGIVKTAGNIAGNLLPVGGGVIKTVTSAIANKMLPSQPKFSIDPSVTRSMPVNTSSIAQKLTTGIGAGAGTASTGAATIKKVSATPVSINPPSTKRQDKIFGAPPKPIVSEVTYFDSPASLVNLNTSSSTTDPDQSKEKSKVMIWIAAGAAFLLLVGSLLFGRKRRR